MKHQAKFDVTAELIVQALALPEGTKLHAIVASYEFPGVFTLYVEHPDLPELTGMGVSEIVPTFSADYTKCPTTWITCNWNVKPDTLVCGQHCFAVRFAGHR